MGMSSPSLGTHAWLSFHPTKGHKATHEEYSFNEVIFVNHSTSQTWSLPENEQFCIKRSISVNGEGLTSFISSVSLVKWNYRVVQRLEDDVSTPGDLLHISMCYLEKARVIPLSVCKV